MAAVPNAAAVIMIETKRLTNRYAVAAVFPTSAHRPGRPSPAPRSGNQHYRQLIKGAKSDQRKQPTCRSQPQGRMEC